MSVQLR
eukprot:gene22480-29109_t